MIQNLKTIGDAIGREIDVYRRVLIDSRTPWYAKGVLGLAIAYFFSPIDLIPDVIPVLGQLDDLLIVPGLLWLALKLIPTEVVESCRAEVMQGTSRNQQKKSQYNTGSFR